MVATDTRVVFNPLWNSTLNFCAGPSQASMRGHDPHCSAFHSFVFQSVQAVIPYLYFIQLYITLYFIHILYIFYTYILYATPAGEHEGQGPQPEEGGAPACRCAW